MKRVIASFVLAFGAFSCESFIFARQVPSNDPSAKTPQILPRPDSRFNGNVGRTYLVLRGFPWLELASLRDATIR
jgi:hypothetical protein